MQDSDQIPPRPTLPIDLKSRKYYLKILAERLKYLHDKEKTIGKSVTYPSYLVEEINALFWVLANYEIGGGVDVSALLASVDSTNSIEIARYQRYLVAIRAVQEYKQNRSDLSDSGNL